MIMGEKGLRLENFKNSEIPWETVADHMVADIPAGQVLRADNILWTSQFASWASLGGHSPEQHFISEEDFCYAAKTAIEHHDVSHPCTVAYIRCHRVIRPVGDPRYANYGVVAEYYIDSCHIIAQGFPPALLAAVIIVVAVAVTATVITYAPLVFKYAGLTPAEVSAYADAVSKAWQPTLGGGILVVVALGLAVLGLIVFMNRGISLPSLGSKK